MSLMTLMQRRIDTVMPVLENQDRPPVERRVVDRSPLTSRTGESQAPAKRSRTPVRICRDFDESRCSTRSISPVRRFSSSENLVTDRRMPCYAQVWLRTEAWRVSISLVYWNFAWDWLGSRKYAATATPFHTWRYQLIIRYCYCTTNNI